MKKATEKAINAALAKYKADIIKELTEAAPKAHIAGDLAALSKLKPIVVDFTLVQAEALKYSKDYSKMLYTKGGNMIDGKFVPWLKESTAQKRQNIAKIITDGLKAGKPTTAIGGRRLGKGTIAYDLAKECSDKGDSWAAMTARTETARIQGHGAMDRYKEQEIEEVRYLCGPNPCEEICAPDCQKVFELSKAPEQPRHPRCVCDYAPVVKREKPEEVRKPEEIKKEVKKKEIKKKKLSKKEEELEEMKTKERATASELWEKTAKDGNEHAKLTNSETFYAHGDKTGIKGIKTPRTPFKMQHTHPGWDSPLSGGDLADLLKVPNMTQTSASSPKHIYLATRRADTIMSKASRHTIKEKFNRIHKGINKKALAALKKEIGWTPSPSQTKKIWRESCIKTNEYFAKEYKFDYTIFKR